MHGLSSPVIRSYLMTSGFGTRAMGPPPKPDRLFLAFPPPGSFTGPGFLGGCKLIRRVWTGRSMGPIPAVIDRPRHRFPPCICDCPIRNLFFIFIFLPNVAGQWTAHLARRTEQRLVRCRIPSSASSPISQNARTPGPSFASRHRTDCGIPTPS